MQLSITSTFKLNNGVEIPRFGLGTWRSPKGAATQNAVRWALEAGYRHIDTAKLYDNEEDVGRIVANGPLKREEVFVTTKVWDTEQGYETTLQACEDSLKRLGMAYIDLYLVHWPIPGLRGETWRALIKLYESGKCRAIGVSNYTIRHLKELLANTPIVPAVNQIEFSPFLYRKELLEFCRSQGIAVEAYSPLSKARKLDNPTLTTVAARHHKTPAQVMIRWALQHDLVVIPKSIHQERILENAAVFSFELTAADMGLLDALNEDYYTVPPERIADQWE
jgi:diketogulonate reductase-like aldo/keto reductase